MRMLRRLNPLYYMTSSKENTDPIEQETWTAETDSTKTAASKSASSSPAGQSNTTCQVRPEC